MAMGSRTDLLQRLVTALSRPGVDGLLATADIAEDLLSRTVTTIRTIVSTMRTGMAYARHP